MSLNDSLTYLIGAKGDYLFYSQSVIIQLIIDGRLINLYPIEPLEPFYNL